MKHFSLRTFLCTLVCISLFQTCAFAAGPSDILRRILQKTTENICTQEGFSRFSSVPILSFHHLSEDPEADLTPDAFEEYLRILSENGYTAILYQDLIDFTDQKKRLPEKPVMITFDDGYTSNYEYAYPLLKKWNMKAEIAIVGYTVGYDYFPKTTADIIPHFTWAQASEMIQSGLISIHSHSYNLHHHAAVEKQFFRLGVQRMKGEREEDYIRVLTSDTKTANREIQSNLGYANQVYTYPYGQYTEISEGVLRKLGIRVTVTNTPGINDVEWGNPQSLKLLRRISCDAVGLDILDMIRKAQRTIH